MTNERERHLSTAQIAAEFIKPALFKEEKFRSIITSLLREKESTGFSKERKTALNHLWDLGVLAASWGVGKIALDLKSEFSPFHLVPTPSMVLVDLGLVTDQEKIKQIVAREEFREERGRGPAENEVVVRFLSSEQRRQYAPNGAVVVFNKTYTITNPESKQIETDREVTFFLINPSAKDNDPQMSLVEVMERQFPHEHAKGVDQWYRIDSHTHPEQFSLPEDFLIPAEEFDGPVSASNGQIAILLALIYGSINQS